MATRTTAEITDRRNHAFVNHDPSAPNELIADVCVTEAIQPAPDGARNAHVLVHADVTLAGLHLDDMTIMRIRGDRVVEALGYVKVG
jgi:hypothetical protein